MAQLQSQLEELIKAKEEDETALLRKFRDLINEKKLRIREQQQVLNTLSTNPSMAGQSQRSQAVEASVQQPKPKKPIRQAGKSRASKRKAPASRRLEESDDDDAVDTMSVDLKQEAVDTDPGNTTEATASGDSDDEDDDGLDSGPPQQNKASDAVSRGKTASRESERPPPPRALPFETKKSTKATPVPAPAGSDTESDDEL